jgi:hypothetical protein
MLGISFLREIVTKEYITHTGVILRKLRKAIVKTLKQKSISTEELSVRDGMDMALISINHKTNILQYSGANNPIYIIRNNKLTTNIDSHSIKLCDNLNVKSKKLFYEIRPDKMPVGMYEKMDRYSSHDIQLEKGDQVYLFSDGYPDQFGGPKGKKFKYKSFKKLIIENSDKVMSEQHKILNNTLRNWQGLEEQVDDIIVLGIKI